MTPKPADVDRNSEVASLAGGRGLAVDNPSPRSPLAKGIEWASRITTLGVGFTLPILAGHFADRQFGTKPALLVVGMILGFAVGGVQLTRITRDASRGL